MTKEHFVKAVLAIIEFLKPINKAVSRLVSFCKSLIYKTKAIDSGYSKSAAFGHLYTVEVVQRLRWYSPFAWTYLAILACGCLTIGPVLGVIYSFMAISRGLKRQHDRPLVIRYTLSRPPHEICADLAKKAADSGNTRRFTISFSSSEVPGVDLLKQAAEEDAVRTVINGGDVHAIGGLGNGF